MGVVLEPTPEMGTWSVEVCLDSACSAVRHQPTVSAEAALPVLSEQRRAMPSCQCLIRSGRRVPSRSWPQMWCRWSRRWIRCWGEPLYFDHLQHGDLDLGCWREPVVEHGWAHVSDPVVDAGVHVSFRWVEVSYSHLAELRYHLVDFLERTCREERL